MACTTKRFACLCFDFCFFLFSNTLVDVQKEDFHLSLVQAISASDSSGTPQPRGMCEGARSIADSAPGRQIPIKTRFKGYFSNPMQPHALTLHLR